MKAENKTLSKITLLLDDIAKFKLEYDDLWSDEYTNIEEELLDIQAVAQDNIVLAQSLLEELPVYRYDSFYNYVYNTNPSTITRVSGTSNRSVSIRAKRKGKKCPVCGGALESDDSLIKCQSCSYVTDKKRYGGRTISDNSKHIAKQLDNVTGARKAPSSIIKILPYVILWLTDMRYIHEWLKFNNRTSKWLDGLYELRPGSNFSLTQSIPRTEENAWDYQEYKLFTDEFHRMLEYARRLAHETASRMEGLDDELAYGIAASYYKENPSVVIPDISAIYEHNGNLYDIGRYINSLSLIAGEHSVKQRIEQLLGQAITVPGLMFNFRDVYSSGENLPKKFVFTQEYAYVIHHAFNTKYIEMANADKAAIVSLMLKFNEYYKGMASKAATGKHNSPLYCCVLMRILMLPYFSKYQGILKIIPKKNSTTDSNIKIKWDQFIVEHAEDIRPYIDYDEIVDVTPETHDGDDTMMI